MGGNGDDGASAPTIAIVGMAGRFPGARDVRAFWANLRAGVESIRFFTDEELLSFGESPDLLRDPAYVRACGQLADIDQFDASFFGMSPRDAAVFDPQHRVFLECAWAAFEDAGYLADKYAGPVGVFASSGASEYMMYNLVRNRDIMDSVGAWLVRHNGNDPNFLATRVSYELNLRGPSMNVQTACSSSLVAVHLAAQSLLNGECDMALAGGSTVYPEQNRGYLYKQGEILSPDGHCRAFDAKAAGTVMASAVGCVVLKRLEDALRDGDRVHAVILGSAINNDGNDKVGYLAPSVSGQTRVISEALAIAGIHPEDVSYVEAHGTGTLIGDPIEIQALTEAFRASTNKTQFCAIGSVKSNIGHAGEAAGISGLIKTVLALEHRQLPPSLHYEAPNPQVDFPRTPFFVNASLRDWSTPSGKPRIAGITGLGAGGTNVHVLVEEAPPSPPSPARRKQQLLVLSARTPAALDAAAKNLATYLRDHADLPLADVAYTLLVGRKGFASRRAVVAKDALDAAAALESGDPKRVASHQQKKAAPSVVFLFPGGGAQYPRMGAELYECEPVYREAIDSCLSHLEPALRSEVRATFFPARSDNGVAGTRLEAPSLALPALFATEYALAKLLSSWGIEPAAMIGHSAGEYAAACLAGVLTPRDAITLVALRGSLFETLPEGGMLSVALSENDAKDLLGTELSFAAINGPGLSVLSGPVDAIARAEEALRAREVECTRVHINVAAHSAMLEPILSEFERFCRTIRFQPPKIPFVSNLTGTWITEAEATDPSYWVRHLRNTVRFGDGMEKVLEDSGRVLVEVGPGRTLSSLARQQARKPVGTATTLRHPQEEGSDLAFVLGTLGRLWVSGVALDEKRLFAGERRLRVPLPTYPFERQRYWVEPDAHSAPRDRRQALHKRANVSEWFYAPAWGRGPLPAPRDAKRATWLVFADASPLSAALVDRLKESEDRVVVVTASDRFASSDDGFTLSPGQRSDYDRLANELRARGLLPDRVAHLWALAPRRSGFGHLRRWNAVEEYSPGLALHYFSLVFLAQAFAGEVDDLHVSIVSSHMQALPGDTTVHPEKAALLGACKVIPREYPHVACASIDVGHPPNRAAQDLLVDQLARELRNDAPPGDVALRHGDRFVRRFDPVVIEATQGGRTWLREGGVVLVTGGLGGIGLVVAEHLARTARAKLVLVGRTPMPLDEDAWLASHDPADETSRRILRLRSLRSQGAEVMTVAADVTDLQAMREVRQRVRARFGSVNGVFHVAGMLKDELIALRPRLAQSPVIDAKMKGALVLDAVYGDEPLDAFVLFGSVSAVLGLPSQADYTAANAFLDAFSYARTLRGAPGRTVCIDWNAWQEVGMLASRVRLIHAEEAGAQDARLQRIASDASSSTFRASYRRASTWFLGEHVVRGGDALIPGTGLLEIARSVLEAEKEPRAVELRDVLFLAPFVVGKDEARTLHVRLERGGGHAFSFYGDSPDATFVTGKAAYVDAPPPSRVDLDAIRARCGRPARTADGFLVQHFMDFGPRWGNVRGVDLGRSEALISLELPRAFVGDLDAHPLHPALLDMATGGAQPLIAGFDPDRDFYVPFSYERVLVRRALTPRVFSHVRYRENGAKDTAVFDVTIVDEAGEELVAIEGFVMRRVAPGAAVASRAAAPTNGAGTLVQRKETPEEIALREGMTPAEGVDALDRILGARFSPQVVACTVDLHAWVNKLSDEARSARGGGVDGATDAGGPVFSRPNLSAAFVAPRDAMERDLAALWGELLGVADVGVNDDFFELGGQSLIAVRLFHRIGKKYGLELSIATLFQAPTIAQCAALLRERLGLPFGADASSPELAPANGAPAPAHAEGPFRSLVTIQKGGNLLPFFCVHGAEGNVLNFRDLSRAFDPAQPFYGLQAYGVDGVTPPHGSLEEMARAYLPEIREVQPRGPYLLGGYSGGGVVAYELAQLLTRAGESVALLAFIDSPSPNMSIRRVNRLTRLLGDGFRKRAARIARGGVGYVVEALERKREEARQAARWARDERAIQNYRARGEPIPYELRALHLRLNFERAAPLYKGEPWPGRAILFRAEDVDFLFAEGGPTYGWDRLVLGGVEVVEVPGNHHTVLLGAGAEVLVRSLGRAIATVQNEVAVAPASLRFRSQPPPATVSSA